MMSVVMACFMGALLLAALGFVNYKMDKAVGSFSYAQKRLSWFASLMLRRLEANVWKGGWQELGYWQLLDRAVGQIAKAYSAIEKFDDEDKSWDNYQKAVQYLADASNYLMMTADQLRKQAKPEEAGSDGQA